VLIGRRWWLALIAVAPSLLAIGCETEKQRQHEDTASTAISTPSAVGSAQATSHVDAAIVFSTPDVPPLRAGEVPPRDYPNYFDPKELGGASVAAYLACLEAFKTARSDIEATARDAYCLCFTDATRLNMLRGRVPDDPSDAQATACTTYAQHPAGPSPFGRAFSVPTPAIAEGITDCLSDVSGRMPEPVGLRVCSCTVDAILKHGKDAPEADFERCGIAARYSSNTGINLTRRQFAALRVESRATTRDPIARDVSTNPRPSPDPPRRTEAPQVVERQPALPADPQPESGSFIPYQGNGMGPTLCADGMYSHSSGRGTCSHHGGVGGGHHHRRR
jgi:hypothetical protein